MKPHPPIPSLSDTSPEVEEVQCRVFRAMPPSRKIELVEDANRTARRLALAGIGLRFPEATEEERFRLLMDLILGEDLAARVYGRRSGVRGR